MNETYRINHEMQDYDRVEGIEFKGLVPELMEIEGINTVGASENNVNFFGVNAKGSDQLEVPSFVFGMDDTQSESEQTEEEETDDTQN